MATTTPLPPPSGVLPPLPDDIVILIALATPRKHLRPFFRLNRRIRDTLWSASFIGGHYKAHSTEVEQVEALAAATGRGDARVVRALLLYGALGAPGTRAFGRRAAGTDRLACVWAPCCSLVCFFSFLCYCFHTPACRPCTACAA